MAGSDRAVLWTVLLAVIPGCLAENTSEVGGMAAASAAAFILLIVIIALLVVGFFWREWYHKRQIYKGKRRVPRWKKAKIARSLTSYQSYDKRSVRNGTVPLGRGPIESRNTTINRTYDSDAWVQEYPQAQANVYEEKTKTMDIGDEETTLIVTDLLPDGVTNPVQEPVVLRQTQATEVNVQTPTDVFTATKKETFSDWTARQDDATTTIRATQNGSVVITDIGATGQRESDASYLRKSNPEGTDIFIAPLVPSRDTFGEDEAVMSFDDEGGQRQYDSRWGTEDNVLF